MSQDQTTPSVDDVLAEAAKAAESKPKKERTKKADGEIPAGANEPKAKKERKPKEPKVDADGNPIVKDPTARVALKVGEETVTLSSIKDKATMKVTGEVGAREGSKRAERAKAFEGSTTVAQFFEKGGVSKDLLRHMKGGRVELYVDDTKVELA